MTNPPHQTGPQKPLEDEVRKSEKAQKEAIDKERYQLLHQLEDWLETPVVILGFIWLALLVVEVIWGLNPFLNALVYLIWGIFIFDFLLRLILAPHKLTYLRNNILTAFSLFVPALRIARVVRLARAFRALRAARGVRLFSMVSSVNRGMRALRKTMQRRGFGYIMALTLVVTTVGAAGIYAFESSPSAAESGINSYGESLWWTFMIMTTLGSEYWPRTTEGRLLTLLLSIYALAVFGYVTATVATFFIGKDVEAAALGAAVPSQSQDAAGLSTTNSEDSLKSIAVTGATTEHLNQLMNQISALQSELNAMREESAELRQSLTELQKVIDQNKPDPPGGGGSSRNRS